MRTIKTNDFIENVTKVINKLNKENIKYLVIDEEEQLRIELHHGEHYYFTNFTVSDVIHAPPSRISGSFGLLDNYEAFNDWIEKQIKDMQAEEKYHELAKIFMKSTGIKADLSLDEFMDDFADNLNENQTKMGRAIQSLFLD